MRRLVCPVCGNTTTEETEFPWFIRLGTACCENKHPLTFMVLTTDLPKQEDPRGT
jgi:hypothetical protein